MTARSHNIIICNKLRLKNSIKDNRDIYTHKPLILKPTEHPIFVIFVLPCLCKLELPVIPGLIIVDGQQRGGHVKLKE